MDEGKHTRVVSHEELRKHTNLWKGSMKKQKAISPNADNGKWTPKSLTLGQEKSFSYYKNYVAEMTTIVMLIIVWQERI